mmetsp:Transcript_16595/g.43359  ORF Transcript_16595/g.43359 Transcript_16595/m.43359 type:complete len:155 (+) Transcript_16595:1157-1621(+)
MLFVTAVACQHPLPAAYHAKKSKIKNVKKFAQCESASNIYCGIDSSFSSQAIKLRRISCTYKLQIHAQGVSSAAALICVASIKALLMVILQPSHFCFPCFQTVSNKQVSSSCLFSLPGHRAHDCCCCSCPFIIASSSTPKLWKKAHPCAMSASF